jgi:hypothetical protein
MNMPGFTAAAAIYSYAAFFRMHAPEDSRSSVGVVTMATCPTGYEQTCTTSCTEYGSTCTPCTKIPTRNCGECGPDQRACPNPNGYGCPVCVLNNNPCPLPR